MDDHPETAGVKVSMRDIYNEVQRQGRLLEKIANSLPDSEDKIEDHENRIANWRCGCGRPSVGSVSWLQSSAR
jgi:hypothetical protein